MYTLWDASRWALGASFRNRLAPIAERIVPRLFFDLSTSHTRNSPTRSAQPRIAMYANPAHCPTFICTPTCIAAKLTRLRQNERPFCSSQFHSNQGIQAIFGNRLLQNSSILQHFIVIHLPPRQNVGDRLARLRQMMQKNGVDADKWRSPSRVSRVPFDTLRTYDDASCHLRKNLREIANPRDPFEKSPRKNTFSERG